MKSFVMILSMIIFGSSVSMAEEMGSASDANMKMQSNDMDSSATMSDGMQKDMMDNKSMDSNSMMKSNSTASNKNIVNIAPEPQTLEKMVPTED